ncbi:alpha-E domain-containing protein [Rhodomicrobium vannielii ATCC 17100]|uniref:alpha-E domain-containing protein n=1 Tax=Rhodomicrobium vannielii TaxID=1069 RepID=UPI00191A9B5C|nr:alpha-E domain-containing protein [Rhodomicrobium vannielii ATCC 17100]
MSSLLSRHAESVFWMARYFERTESLGRVIETQTSFQRGRGDDNGWAWIVALYSDEEAFAKAFPEANSENVIRFYMAHTENPGSIQSSIKSARENARALRPMLSIDMWYQLNDFCNRVFAFSNAELSEVRLSRTCDAIKRGCYAQIGVAENTLYHDETWPFFRLGLFLERADQTSRLLDVRFAQQQTGLATDEGHYDHTFWSILLRAASAYHAYRRVHPRHIDPREVARFLIFDPRLPRSIAYCLSEMQAMIELLRRNFGLRNAGPAAERVEAMIEGLQTASNDDNLLQNLHAFNDWVQSSLILLNDELGKAFFGYAKAAEASVTLPAPVAIGQAQSQSQTQVAR